VTTAYNLEDFSAWMTELHGIMRDKYAFNDTVIANYGSAENWEDYYNEEYSPLEAISEDEELHWEQ
jgi:hypothetical protein